MVLHYLQPQPCSSGRHHTGLSSLSLYTMAMHVYKIDDILWLSDNHPLKRPQYLQCVFRQFQIGGEVGEAMESSTASEMRVYLVRYGWRYRPGAPACAIRVVDGSQHPFRIVDYTVSVTPPLALSSDPDDSLGMQAGMPAFMDTITAPIAAVFARLSVMLDIWPDEHCGERGVTSGSL